MADADFKDIAITGVIGLVMIGAAADYTGYLPRLGGIDAKAKVAKVEQPKVAPETIQRSIAELKSQDSCRQQISAWPEHQLRAQGIERFAVEGPMKGRRYHVLVRQ